jgi:hypothetical protein
MSLVFDLASGYNDINKFKRRMIMKQQLTSDECNLLIECVDAWKSSDVMAGLMTGMLMMGLSREDSEEKRHKQFDDATKKGQEESRSKEERAVLLKAKLIHLRDQLSIEEVSGELNRA